VNKVVKAKEETVKYKCIWCGRTITENSAYMSKSDNQFEGRMIWCKNCVNEQYKEYYSKHNGDVARGIFLACRKFDLPYLPNKLDMALNQLKDEEYSSEKVLSIYMTKLYFKHNLGDPVCFDQGVTELLGITSKNEDEQDLVNKWGLYTSEEYEFLELELEDWKQTHQCEKKAELVLLKEICIKQLDIRNARREKKDTAGLIKELQDLMKTANVDPAKAKVIDSGKAVEAFGNWIKDIEQYRPAEWLKTEGKDLFYDVDNIDKYFKDFVVRPLSNFVTGNRDFNIDEDLVVDFNSEGG
jgi:DNA-directed RNA polymerase subunit RPC12/RpoP